jgi:hypothetical protein
MKAFALTALIVAACVDSTGGQLVTFTAAAAGPADATGTLTVDTGAGWHVVLTEARLHVGAIYLNRSVPNSGAQATNCIEPGIYTGEVLVGRDVDLLSAAPQAFPQAGTGTDDVAHTEEVWLTGGDVNAASDPTLIAALAGTATKGATTIDFTATITIGANRLIPSTDPTTPSLHPICKQRIVSPIVTDLAPHDGGTLLLRVDPRVWLGNVDFTGATSPLAFPDDNSTTATANLFTGLRSTGGYQLSFQ